MYNSLNLFETLSSISWTASLLYVIHNISLGSIPDNKHFTYRLTKSVVFPEPADAKTKQDKFTSKAPLHVIPNLHMVPRVGVEPTTQRFSVSRSTNWATWASIPSLKEYHWCDFISSKLIAHCLKRYAIALANNMAGINGNFCFSKINAVIIPQTPQSSMKNWLCSSVIKNETAITTM